MWLLIIIAVVLHFIFDWVLQPRHIAKTKKKSLKSLGFHMLFNILPFCFILSGVLLLFGYENTTVLGIFALNFVSHFLIDMILPAGKSERAMINWTAVDQILHITILILLLQF